MEFVIEKLILLLSKIKINYEQNEIPKKIDIKYISNEKIDELWKEMFTEPLHWIKNKEFDSAIDHNDNIIIRNWKE